MSQPSSNTNSQQGFLPNFRASSLGEFGAICIIVLTLALFRWRALIDFSSLYIGGTSGDAGLYVWLVKSNIRDLFELPWFNTNAFYPYTRTLAWSDNFILPALIIWPLLKVGVPLVAAYNSLILLASFLTGYLTYRLAFNLTGNLAGAVFAGVGFMTYPFLTAHLGHPQLQFAFWLPLAAILTLRALRTPGLWLWPLLTGLTFTGAFLCTVYYAVFAALVISILFGSIVLLRPAHLSIREFGIFVAGTTVGAVCSIPFALPYLDTLEIFGPRQLYEGFYFAASSASFFSAPPGNLIYGASSGLSHAEANLFPGVLVILGTLIAFSRLLGTRRLRLIGSLGLASLIAVGVLTVPQISSPTTRLVAAVLTWISLGVFILLLATLGKAERKLGFNIISNRDLIGIFLLLGLLTLTLALGPLGNPEKGQLAIAPYTLFHSTFPGFSAIRATGRIGIIAVFAALIAGAFAFSYLESKLKRWAPLLWGLIPLLALESYTPIYPLEPLKEPSYAWKLLGQEPRAGDAMIALPLAPALDQNDRVKGWGKFAKANVEYMLSNVESGRPTVNGWSGHRSFIMREFPRELKGFPDRRSLRALRQIAGLRYVIYHPEYDPTFDQKEFESRLALFSDSLSLMTRDEAGNYLLELTGLTEIDDDLTLWIPSFPARILTLEVLPVFSKQLELVNIELSIPDYYGDTPIHSFEIKTDGSSKTLQFPLPEVSEHSRPIKLKVSVKSDKPLPAKIMLHRSRVDYSTLPKE